MRGAAFALGSLLAVSGASTLDVPTAAAQVAGAGTAPRQPLGASLSGAAKEAYDAAVVLVDNHDFAHAIVKYRQAYDLSKDPRLLYDIALCDRDLRQYAAMQGLLVRYVTEAGAELSREEREDVESALAAIHPLIGAVHVKVSEGGATISLDGEPAGTAPLAAPLVVDLGRHTLLVKKEGFEPAERSLEIAGGNETFLTVSLVRKTRTAQLRVAAEAAATIVIDKRELAHGSFDGALPPGEHDVQVSEPGKKPYEVRLALADGEARILEVTLEDRPHAVIWPWIAGGVAVLAAAGVGGYFLLRPQDTRGTGPQGQLLTVQLPPGAN